jgi:beta-N-acetylhexosaminidase
LSPRVLSALLREQLAYDGVIVSDDLEMKAVANQWKPSQAAVLAAQAGCDLLPVCKTVDAQVEAIEGLVRALESGEVSWKSAEAAEARSRRLKERFLLPYRDPDPEAARLAAGIGERRALAEEIGERGGVPA